MHPTAETINAARRGDPNPHPDAVGDCPGVEPQWGFDCTLDAGHPGDQHVAVDNSERVVRVWPRLYDEGALLAATVRR